jgi:hypothetical protein
MVGHVEVKVDVEGSWSGHVDEKGGWLPLRVGENSKVEMAIFQSEFQS